MISTELFRKIRLKTMKQCLESVGFRRRAANLYLRETASHQLHSLQFLSGGRVHHEFAVEIGFHYSFVPEYNESGSVAEPEDYFPRNCCFNMRLRNPESGQFYKYGETPEDSEAMLREIVIGPLTNFAQIEEQWSDGSRLLDALTPAIMEEDERACRWDIENFEASFARASEAYQKTLLHNLFSSWNKNQLSVCVLLGYIALQRSRFSEAKKYLDIVKKRNTNDPTYALKRLKELIKKSI